MGQRFHTFFFFALEVLTRWQEYMNNNKIYKLLAVAFVALVIGLLEGCTTRRCGNDPIVNPGVDADKANSGAGYTPWWVIDLFPNGEGKTAY